MSVFYSLIKEDNKKKLEFQTSSKELYEDVAKYVANCLDAIRYRNRVEQVKVVDDGELTE